MQKTQNFSLNKPEATDPMRLNDFNENSDIIDAALGALNTAVAKKGNCTIETGTYAGNGNFGSGKNISLTFSKQPWVVFIGGGGYNVMMIRNNSSSSTTNYNGDVSPVVLTWSGNKVSWYSTVNSYTQMNASGTTYTYLALLT